MADGWRCPGCGRCYSPSVTMCAHCDPSARTPSRAYRDLLAAATEIFVNVAKDDEDEMPVWVEFDRAITAAEIEIGETSP